MSEFSRSHSVKATKKGHVCEQCGRSIDIGSPAQVYSGKYEGEVFSIYSHPECAAAAKEFADMNNMWGEEYPWFQHMENSEFDHHAWLLEKHPVVAERLNIEREVAA